MEARAHRIVFRRGGASGPENDAKMTIVVLDVVIAFIAEGVLAEAETSHDRVVKTLGTREIRDRQVDMIDANDFYAHYGNVEFYNSRVMNTLFGSSTYPANGGHGVNPNLR
jgi:hypothetical protein